MFVWQRETTDFQRRETDSSFSQTNGVYSHISAALICGEGFVGGKPNQRGWVVLLCERGDTADWGKSYDLVSHFTKSITYCGRAETFSLRWI